MDSSGQTAVKTRRFPQLMGVVRRLSLVLGCVASLMAFVFASRQCRELSRR